MFEVHASRPRRFAAVATATLVASFGLVVGAAQPSLGAPPGNDTIANARPISGIPDYIEQSTRQATSSANDGECVGGASVWYRFRPTTTSAARVATLGSSIDTLLAVYKGPRASRTLVACSDDAVGLASAVQVRFVAGVRYWIAVSACCDSTAAGGQSVLRLYRPRPAAITTTLDSVETGAVSGRLFASGTVRCATPSAASLSVTVSQRAGTFVARGSNYLDLPFCNATPRPWSVRIDSETAVAFQQGEASVTVQSATWDGFNSAAAEQTENVTVGSNPNRVTQP